MWTFVWTLFQAPLDTPGQRFRKNMRPATAGGRIGTDFCINDSFKWDPRTSHSTMFPSGSLIRIVLSVNWKRK